MRNSNVIAENYYIWLLNFIDCRDYSTYDYSKLLDKLFNTEFYSKIDYDDNRIMDGFDLRNRFAEEENEHVYYLAEELPEYCSVLEMMIALALRIENEIMSDDKYGDRTSLWFWMMVENLGLADSYNRRYDDNYVTDILEKFLDRKYDFDGKGGLFWVKNWDSFDLRGTEIWYQAQYFLHNFL